MVSIGKWRTYFWIIVYYNPNEIESIKDIKTNFVANIDFLHVSLKTKAPFWINFSRLIFISHLFFHFGRIISSYIVFSFLHLSFIWNAYIARWKTQILLSLFYLLWLHSFVKLKLQCQKHVRNDIIILLVVVYRNSYRTYPLEHRT